VLEGQPRVTIGIPVYNGERHLRRALESLLAQDYRALEIMVSDNASTDATRSIAEEFARRDPRVRLDVNERNIGAVSNFRKLVSKAETPYFMWAAYDDVWFPTFVSRMVDELDRHPGAGVAFCAVDLVDDEGAPTGQIRFQGADDPNHRTNWEMAHRLLTPRKYNLWVYGLFRTSLLREVIDRSPDMLAWDRWLILVMAMATRFRYVDEVLHRRTVRPRALVPTFLEEAGIGARTIATLARVIPTSPVIPWTRKLWTPLILGHYALILVNWPLLVGARRLHRKLGSPLRPLRRRARS
jgi:glycosyltransferase involved in cell wall biosynthesis